MTKNKEEDQNNYDLCGKCNKTVSDEEAIYCDGLCKKWYDIECVKLKTEEYHYITKLSNKVKWYCPQCTKYIADLLKMKMV